MFLEYIKKYEKNSIIINIIMIIVSILLIINPVWVLNAVTIIFGIGILADGIFHLISYFKTNQEARIFSGDLFEGIIAILAGWIILVNKAFIFSILPIIIGIWLIIRSIMKLQLALNLKSANSEKWLWVLISSILTLLLGALILMNPFGTVQTVTVIAGIILLISSIIDIAESFVIIKTIK